MNEWELYVAHYRQHTGLRKLSFQEVLDIFDAYCDWKKERKAA